MRREDRIKDVTTESGSDKSADLIIRSVLSMDCYGETSFTECGQLGISNHCGEVYSCQRLNKEYNLKYVSYTILLTQYVKMKFDTKQKVSGAWVLNLDTSKVCLCTHSLFCAGTSRVVVVFRTLNSKIKQVYICMY